jgi:pimeloyl-ACP methyl ester carboxylesterase
MTAEDEVGQGSDRFHAALDSIVDGDAPPMAEVWSHDSGVSTMHPLAGREHGAVRPRRAMRSLFARMCAVMAPIGGFWRADFRADTAVCFATRRRLLPPGTGDPGWQVNTTGTQGDDTTVRRALTSIRWSWLAAAFVAGLIWAAPAEAQRAEPGPTGSPALAPAATDGDFARRVAIRGGRKLYVECRGTGSPTVVLESGTGDRADVWSAAPSGPGRAVLPAVARFTRVCAYDRPGTYLRPGVVSRSDPVAMPQSARDIVLDLRALLRAAHIRGPYVLVGHSFGGLVARLFATTYPRHIAGLVSIDAQNEDYAAAFKEFLTPEQYAAAVLNPGTPPGFESYSGVERLSLEVSAAQMRQAQADTPLRRMPLVVLSHSRDLPNPFGFPPDWPAEALERAFQASQNELAKLVPRARHVIAAKSGHYIQLDQPRLVTRAIRWVVRAARSR